MGRLSVPNRQRLDSMAWNLQLRRHGGTVTRRGLRERLRQTTLPVALFGAVLATPAPAAELLDLVVVRVTWRGDAPSAVEPTCLLTSGEAVPPPMRARGATGEDFARRFLDHLERFDSQRAESHAEELDGLFDAREFLSDVSLAASLVTSGLAADEAALAADLADRVGVLELDEGQTLEPLAAWLSEAEGEPPHLLVDSRLWHSLDDERQGMVLVQQLAQLEQTRGASSVPNPCRLLTFLIAPDLAELGMSDYYAHLAGRGASAPLAGESSTADEIILTGGVRFDRLFNPMNERSTRKRRQVVDGYEVRKLGLIAWRARADLEAEHETTQIERPDSGIGSDETSTVYTALAGVDFDGYIYHPRLLRFGATVGVLWEQGDLSFDGVAGDTSSPFDSLRPQIGLSAVLFPAKPATFTFAYNKYRSQANLVSDDYSVTDRDVIEAGVIWKNALIPTTLNLSHSRVEESERTSGRTRDEQVNKVTIEASHATGPTDTELVYRYREIEEERRHLLGAPLVDVHRETQSLNLRNELRIKPLDGHLDSRLNWLDETGDRPSRRLLFNQQLTTHHREDLLGRYGLKYGTRSRPSGKEQLQQDNIALFGDVAWKPLKTLRVNGGLDLVREDAGLFMSDETSVSGAVHWERQLKAFHLQAWGQFAWSTVDETGMTGLRDVFDERHVLSAETTALLEHPDIELDSLLVSSVDKTMTWVEGVDYRVDLRGDFVEISRIETGSLPEGSVVSADYAYLLELRGPLAYDRWDLHAGLRVGFRRRYQVHASWRSRRHDVSVSDDGGARLQDESHLRFGASARWGRFSARLEQQDLDREDSSYVTRRAGIDFNSSFGGIHALSVHLGWQESDYLTARDESQYVVTLRYSVKPVERWPRVEVVATYRPFESAEHGEYGLFNGSPYLVTVKLSKDIGRLELVAGYSLDHLEDEFYTRDEQTFRISLRRVW